MRKIINSTYMLELVGTRPLASGIVILSYRPGRPA